MVRLKIKHKIKVLKVFKELPKKDLYNLIAHPKASNLIPIVLLQ